MPKKKARHKKQTTRNKKKTKSKKLTTQKLFAKIREYWYVVVAVLVVFTPLYIFIFNNLPSPTRLRSSDTFATSTQILDRNGKILFEVYADKSRKPVPIDELPQLLLEATVAIEDQNFYRHPGIDMQGVVRAMFSTLFKQQLQGGSTITQQLIKTTLLTPERTLQRKIREAILAIATEIIYSKKQILEMYLNFTPYGGIAYGVESAAQLYFNKPARSLNLAESALIAGLPQAPTRYSPFGSSPETAQSRQKEVLRRMQEDNYINENQRLEAENQPLEYATNTIDIKAPHFALYVKDLLVEKYGQKTVETGGLKVTTTLDLQLQNYAQATVSAEVANLNRLRVTNGATIITRPSTGEILSMVGSKDYFDSSIDGQVNITLRYRQPGSSIKPINYAGIIAKGYPLSTMVLDIPTCFLVAGQPLYCPKNYDNSFHGPVQLRSALANSYNLPAVKFLALNTIEDMIATASAMGITGWDDSSRYGLSLTLGGGEVRMIDMAVAFGTFANSGTKVPLQAILKVQDPSGNILEEYDPEKSHQQVEDLLYQTELTNCQEKSNDCQTQPVRVIPRDVAYLISHILQDNPSRTPAFGPSSPLVVRSQIVSAKTGTTNDMRDNWTVGYTPEYLVATWVGNNDNSPMLTSGVTGAAPIWHDLISHLLENKTATWPEKPANVIAKQVCTNSGLFPSAENPCSTRSELFIEDTNPLSGAHSIRGIWINKDTSLPAFTGDIPPDEVNTDNLQLQEHTVLSDPFTKDFCLSCPWPQEVNEDGTPKENGKIGYPQQTIDLLKFYGQPIEFQLPQPSSQ